MTQSVETSAPCRDAQQFHMAYTRVYSCADGSSHFQDESLPMAPGVYVPGIPLVYSAATQTASAIRFSWVAAGYDSDWHPAPRRQFVMVLSGTVEVTVGDGEARRFGPGSVVLDEDTDGQGHQTRAPGAEDVVWAALLGRRSEGRGAHVGRYILASRDENLQRLLRVAEAAAHMARVPESWGPGRRDRAGVRLRTNRRPCCRGGVGRARWKPVRVDFSSHALMPSVAAETCCTS